MEKSGWIARALGPWPGLVQLKDRFDIAFGNDPDADRHGIVTPSSGLLNPNHYLAVAIRYLLTNRPQWPVTAVVGKTLVSSCLIDRVVASLERTLWEVPVGFKWFTPGLFDGSCCFGGEESAGASFLKRDGSVWSTDKDGLILGSAGRGNHRAHRERSRRALQGTNRQIRHPLLHPDRRPSHARAKEFAQKTIAGSRHRHRTRRRTDHGEIDARARQQCIDRRLESRLGERLVCRPPFRHREHLQALRGKPEKCRTPQRHRRSGPGDRPSITRRELIRLIGKAPGKAKLRYRDRGLPSASVSRVELELPGAGSPRQRHAKNAHPLLNQSFGATTICAPSPYRKQLRDAQNSRSCEMFNTGAYESLGDDVVGRRPSGKPRLRTDASTLPAPGPAMTQASALPNEPLAPNST